MSIKIKVTQEHINNGIKCSGVRCPIALALNFAGDIFVDECYIDDIDGNRRFNTPPEASAFVSKFDAGFAVEPFEFELSDPQPLVDEF